MIKQSDIQALCGAASIADFSIEPDNLELLQWNAGESHKPLALPANRAAVYIFKWNDTYLKVGKVNANSSPRYQSQHYLPGSSRSNLSRSLLGDRYFIGSINDENVGEWIRANTTRFNILIPADLGKDFVHFAEAFFILKCRPRYEDARL